MRAARLRQTPAGLWEALAAAAPNASFFLTPRYAAIAARAHGVPLELFAFECDDGVRVALPARRLPGPRLRRTYACPGGGLPGGLLAETGLGRRRSAAVLAALARIPDAAFRLTLDPRDALGLPPAPERTLRRDRFFVLDLGGGYAQVESARFAKDFREGCRRAGRRGVTAAVERTRAAFQDFARLHAQGSEAWDAGSRVPAALFEACADDAGAAGSPLELVLARDAGGAAVAGVLGVCRGDTFTCWLAAMDRKARPLAPSTAAYRCAIERACALGAERFLLGASGGIASVEAFKRSLGAEAVDAELHVEVRGVLREAARRSRALGRWVRDLARGTRAPGPAA